MSKAAFLLLVLVCALSVAAQETKAPKITQGSLFARARFGKDLGSCPLKNTTVKAEISGFVTRVRVRQEFENSLTQPIEAVYTFPLSQNGAVDDMTMTVGSRTIRGAVLKREEAREIYEQAKIEGKVASLLDQERPNIFTQSVANIMPGEKIIVEISYIETLEYEDGVYEFVFPMTVGPRYIPASVSDAAKISPPIAVDRPGHDISVEVNLNAGVPVEEIRSTSHDIQQTNFSPNSAQIVLKSGTTIPNKDFVLRYDVTGGKIQDAMIVHRSERGGFFTLLLQPPDKIATEDRTPKEIVFVLDTSGSMSGFPIEKAKEAMRLSLEGLYPDDTFNFITFAGDTEVLFERPVPATQSNVMQALSFLESRRGSGATEMMKAIKTALDPSGTSDHLRVVCFMTDGYVGNEEEIIAEVQRHPKARVFSFGIGNSVNRYLLDKIAEAGRGEAEYVSLEDDGSKAARKFYERVRTPLLTDLAIEWNGLSVTNLYPSKLTDLFSAKPVIVHGRYSKPMTGKLTLRGNVAGQPYSREIAVNFPEIELANDSLASLWARSRIDELSSEKLRATTPAKSAAFDSQILALGLKFRLMTQLTSFIAVEDRIVNQNGKPTTIRVPVGLADGVDPETSGANRYGDPSAKFAALSTGTGSGGGLSAAGVFTSSGDISGARVARRAANKNRGSSGSGSGSGVGYGSGQGIGYGTGAGSAGRGGPPPPMAAAATTHPLRIISKPRAKYTEASRTNNIQGSVRLKVTLLASGQVGSITPVTRLPHGLTEEAIAAARLLRFEPAKVNGVPVSKTITIDYSFTPDGMNSTDPQPSEVMVRPAYPKGAGGKLGEVEIEIETDAEGNVVNATAISGPDELRETCVNAANLSNFAPMVEKGRQVRTTGIIAYNFASQDEAEIIVKGMKSAPPNADDKRIARIQDVMHFWLYDTIARLSKGVTQPTVNEAKFVRDGKASIRIELTEAGTSVQSKLRELGVEFDSINGTIVKGRIGLDKLASLAEIEQVKYVAPAF